MKTISKTGRIIFSVPFILFGLFHFMGGDAMAGMVPSWLPGGVLWVYLTGLGLIAGGVSLLTGKYAYWAGISLAVMLGSFILLIHLPMAAAGGEMAKFAMPAVLKDLSMIGGALFLGSSTVKSAV